MPTLYALQKYFPSLSSAAKPLNWTTLYIGKKSLLEDGLPNWLTRVESRSLTGKVLSVLSWEVACRTNSLRVLSEEYGYFPGRDENDFWRLGFCFQAKTSSGGTWASLFKHSTKTDSLEPILLCVFPLFFLVFVFVYFVCMVYMCVQIHLHMCVCGGHRQPRLSFLRSRLRGLFKTDSLTGVWDLSIRLDLMVSEFQRPSWCHFSLCTRIRKMHHHGSIFMWLLGLNSDEFILVQQALYQQNYTVNTFLYFKVIISVLDYRDIYFVPCSPPRINFLCRKKFEVWWRDAICSSGWHWAHPISQSGLKLMTVFLSESPKCWDHRYVPLLPHYSQIIDPFKILMV